MVQSTERLCQCGFNAEYITDYAFQCFPNSDQQVTFRAKLHGTAHANSSQLIENIEQWVNRGTSIAVWGLRVNIDTCPVVITSFGDPQCLDETTQSTFWSDPSTQTQTTPPMLPISTKTTSDSIATAALVFGVVAVVSVLAVIVIIINRAITVPMTKNQKCSYSTDRDVG